MAAFAAADVRLAESSQDHRDECPDPDVASCLLDLLAVLAAVLVVVIVVVVVVVLVVLLEVLLVLFELVLECEPFEQVFVGVVPALRFRSTRYSTLSVLLPA